MELYKEAANLGQSMAQLRLGEAYLCGNGVEQDDSRAVKWFEEAARGQIPRALTRMKLFEPQRDDRIESRCAIGRVNAKDDAHETSGCA